MLLSSALTLALAGYDETSALSFLACVASVCHRQLCELCEACEGCNLRVRSSPWCATALRVRGCVELHARFWLPALSVAYPALRRPPACQQSLRYCLAILVRRDSVSGHH